MTDLIAKLDEAAAKMLEKAFSGDNMADIQEAFKIVASWTERRAKLIPAEPKKDGGGKFGQLKGQLNGGSGRKASGRGATPKEDEDTPRPDA